MAFLPPPRWATQELKAQRDRAEDDFRERRRDEGPRAFASACADIAPHVRWVLEMTDDLRAVDAAAFVTHPERLHETLRYCCAPPISEEDLWTLVGGPKFKRVPESLAADVAFAFAPVLDPVRFPWLIESRPPTETERDAAVLATTVMLAARLVATSRRGESSTRQEAAVGAALDVAGFHLDPSRDPMTVLDILARGSFSRERRVADAKCDVPVRLHDGRLLAVECKVSNGPKNGWKRVNREVGGKAELWKQRFGSQIVTAVVLAGVLDLACLVSAQATQGVVLFWEHDLSPLAEFVADAR